jgi:hypothetical protein
MLTHGVCYSSVFSSVWGVVDVINKNPALKIKFPSKQEQLKIAKGYEKISNAGFDRVIGAIDGILIWIIKPRVWIKVILLWEKGQIWLKYASHL